jgi:hypothetical protein
MSDNDDRRVPLQPLSTDSGYFIRPEPAPKPAPEALAGRHNAQMETLVSVMERGTELLKKHKQRDS